MAYGLIKEASEQSCIPADKAHLQMHGNLVMRTMQQGRRAATLTCSQLVCSVQVDGADALVDGVGGKRGQVGLHHTLSVLTVRLRHRLCVTCTGRDVHYTNMRASSPASAGWGDACNNRV